MGDGPVDREREDAATEAVQNVVDEVTSWEYGAETEATDS